MLQITIHTLSAGHPGHGTGNKRPGGDFPRATAGHSTMKSSPIELLNLHDDWMYRYFLLMESTTRSPQVSFGCKIATNKKAAEQI